MTIPAIKKAIMIELTIAGRDRENLSKNDRKFGGSTESNNTIPAQSMM